MPKITSGVTTITIDSTNAIIPISLGFNLDVKYGKSRNGITPEIILLIPYVIIFLIILRLF